VSSSNARRSTFPEFAHHLWNKHHSVNLTRRTYLRGSGCSRQHSGRSPGSSKERERHTDYARPPSGAHRRSEASGRCAISGSAIKVSQQSEIVSAISSWLKR
jgi:hypothetical protein